MSKRLRDPVHGLIHFDDEDELRVDMLAWRLLDTPEFQRLRRIRQLGVSEFTFPGAVHTRFSHSIGVFHTARALVSVIRRELSRDRREFDVEKARVALVAALLHDLGHGPFSHAFEEVQKSRGVQRRHEQWTAEIIRNSDGAISRILEEFEANFSEKVALLLEKEEPDDIYHAVVSSSLDADRLDYLRRDRLMTGVGAGAIDFDWLIENVRVEKIEIDAPDDSDEARIKVPTFCLDKKALPAAEQFLWARYALFQQVYLHKATRCMEHMIGKLLRALARSVTVDKAATGLPQDHALIRFFEPEGETVQNYLALDDALVMGSLDMLVRASDGLIAETATRLQNRQLYKTLDLAEFGEDHGTQSNKLRRIKSKFADQIEAQSVMIDDQASVGIYAEIGGDDERLHKKLHILDAGAPVEISKMSSVIEALTEKKAFRRVYFQNAADRDAVRHNGK